MITKFDVDALKILEVGQLFLEKQKALINNCNFVYYLWCMKPIF